MNIAFYPGMLNQVFSGIRGLLLPAPASQTVFIEGERLSVKSFSHARSLSAFRLKVDVPCALSYGVEYRVSKYGEFRVDRGLHGSLVLVVKNNREGIYCMPVCWLPERFLGKNVDRYIVHVNGKKTNYRAGMKEEMRASGNGDFRRNFNGPPVRYYN